MSKQQGEKNFEMFKAWVSTMSDDDFAAIVYPASGKLNRGQIKKLSGLSDETLKRNSQVVSLLKAVENGLRERGVLPPLTDTAKKAQAAPKKYDNSEAKRAFDQRRSAQLEADNHNLRVQVDQLEREVEILKSKLASNGEMLEALDELGVFRLCPSR